MLKIALAMVLFLMTCGPGMTATLGYDWDAYYEGESDTGLGHYRSREYLQQRYPGKDRRSLEAYKDGFRDHEPGSEWGNMPKVIGEDEYGNPVRR